MKITIQPWFHGFNAIFCRKYEHYLVYNYSRLISLKTLSSGTKYLNDSSSYETKSKISPAVYHISQCHSNNFVSMTYTKCLFSNIYSKPVFLSSTANFLKHYSTNSSKKVDGNNNPQEVTPKKSIPDKNIEDDESKLGLVQKFKLMYKRYWYVLIPVHCVTSVIWYGGFFFAAKSGVDIVPLLENIGLSERFLHYLRDSNAGYYGIAYAMYKLATPARYTVTLGGTTVSINYLKNRGYIKPVPTRDELKVMYEDKKHEIKDKTEEMREKYHDKREEILGKAGEIHDLYLDKKDEIKQRYRERRKEFMKRPRSQRSYKDKYKPNGKKR